MAEIFKNFTKKVASIADTAKNKTKELYDVTKLKVELGKKEVDLDECFEKLGRAYFVQKKREKDNNDKIDALLEKANTLSNEIYEIKKSIADAQNKKICDHCISIIDTDAPYCSNCGQKVVAEKKDDSTVDTEENAD